MMLHEFDHNSIFRKETNPVKLKHTLKVIKSLKRDNINHLFYALNRNEHAELYLPSMFQTSDIELLSPKNENYISLNHTSITIFINCVYTFGRT